MYKDDLAYIQHHGFPDFARAVSPGVLTILRRAGITSGHVLDLGCGDGAWLRMLTGAGFAATGIEQSSGLPTYGRKAAPKAIVKIDSVYRSAFPRCRLLRDIVTLRKTREGYRRREEKHVLAVSAPRSMLADLRRAGFVARSLRGYGDFLLPLRRLAFVARKPEAA